MLKKTPIDIAPTGSTIIKIITTAKRSIDSTITFINNEKNNKNNLLDVSH